MRQFKRLNVFVALLIFSSISTTFQANASSDSIWLNNEEITIQKSQPEVPNTDDDGIPGCRYSEEPVQEPTGIIKIQRACVVEGSAIDIATYALSNGYKGFAVKQQSSNAYKTIIDLTTSRYRVKFMPQSDGLFLYDNSFRASDREAPLRFFNNLSESIEPGRDNFDNLLPYYSLNKTMGKALFGHSDQSSTPVYPDVVDYTISYSGKYVVANLGYAGYVHLDMETEDYRIIGNQAGSIYGGYYNPRLGSVSDDGRYLYIENLWRIYDLKNCGDKYSDYFESFLMKSHSIKNECGYKDISAQIATVTDSRFYGTNHKFESDNKTIFFNVVYIDTVSEQPFSVRVTAGSSSKSFGLDYLALGDSYSSGEGDIGKLADGSSFYLPGTEGDNECHISVRSYPFLLAEQSELEPDRMQSVACSGARVGKDYHGTSEGYLGQGGRLKGLSSENVLAAQVSASKNFTPGIIKQIEFVKENKPKVITITGGGNDIGFVNLLKGCLQLGLNERIQTCDEATLGTKKRSILGDAIRSQYDGTLQLIEALKQASDKTTIHIVGYPSFVSDAPTNCINGALLNRAERATINASIGYLNEVLAAAAQAGGAKYIDTTDSLTEGRLCEGSEYVTGLLNFLTSGAHYANAFHPNAAGHARLAEKISASSFNVTPNDNPAPQQVQAPPKPATFGNSDYIPTFQEKLISMDSLLQVGTALNVSSPAGIILSAGSKMSFTLYSSPTSLGVYTVPASGVVSTSVRIPKTVEPGFHMLVAEVSLSGKVTNRFYEYVEIYSSKTDDKDGDGIKDPKDPCLFITSWVDESTGNDVCKPSGDSQPGRRNEGKPRHAHPHKTPNPPMQAWGFWNRSSAYYIFYTVLCLGVFSLRFR